MHTLIRRRIFRIALNENKKGQRTDSEFNKAISKKNKATITVRYCQAVRKHREKTVRIAINEISTDERSFQ